MSIFEKLFSKQISAAVSRRVKLMLTDADGFYEQHSGLDQRDRYDYDREDILRQVLEAWRMNPIARRIVQLTTQYVVGGGIQVTAKHKGTNTFLQEFWNHALNQLPARVFEWCDELIRSGEVFLVVSTNAAGMSFIRAIPAIHIEDVETVETDAQQETAYLEKEPLNPTLTPALSRGERGSMGGTGLGEGRRWPAYDESSDSISEDGKFTPVMLHFAINRPAGAVRGESDLAPMLKWITRYTAWLEDRVRLNRFRQAFLFVVTGKFASEEERAARQATLSQNPPNPGAILVTDESEEWSVLKPELDTFEAKEDGLAIKKMVAAGAAVPLHFLAEPEGTNRTTAESAGGPTFRHFEQRQEYFTWMVKETLKVVCRRRAMVDSKIKPNTVIEVRGTDLSARDNIAMAQASAEILTAFTGLYEKGLIDGAELVRMAYRFAGETVDIQNLLDRGEKDIQDRPTAEKPAEESDGAEPAKPAEREGNGSGK